MPLISVIIPAFNAADFITEAIESILAQTVTDFEILVIDDGSSDATADIVSRFGEPVRLLRQENGGPAKARNQGIREARGEFVAFLDADDIWKETKLKKQLALFEADPELGMVFTEGYVFNQEGIFRKNLSKRERLMSGNLPQNILLHSGLSTPTVMLRKRVLDEIGLFEESLAHAEDDNLWIRVAVRYPVELIDEALVGVRDHDRRTTRNIKLLVESVKRNIELLKSHKYGPEVWEAVAPIVPRVLAKAHFDLGYIRFEENDLSSARSEFVAAIGHYWRHWPVYQYLFFSLLPKFVVRRLKKAKHRLASNNQAG